MTKIAIATLTAAAGFAAGQVFEQELGTGALDEGVQVEVGGIGGSPFFANAQGNDDGFQEFYVMRFDLSGYTGGAVAGVELDLLQSVPFFANEGLVSLSYSTDDSTDLSTLVADPAIVGGNSQLGATQVATFDFVPDDGTIDTYVLSDVDGLFADIEAGGVITLILEAAEPTTAATYTGIGNFDGGPVLRVIPVPAPAGFAALGLGGLVAARRRRA